MNTTVINFKIIIPGKVAGFDIYDQESGIIMSDTVRLVNYEGSSRLQREALTPYSFWLNLKNFVGFKKPKLHTNNIDILRNIFEMFKDSTYLRSDPWLFS